MKTGVMIDGKHLLFYDANRHGRVQLAVTLDAGIPYSILNAHTTHRFSLLLLLLLLQESHRQRRNTRVFSFCHF